MHEGSWKDYAIDFCVAGGVEEEEVGGQDEVTNIICRTSRGSLRKGKLEKGVRLCFEEGIVKDRGA